MEKWELEKRDELLQQLADLGVDITVKRQYSVGYHPVSLEIKTNPEGYELVNEFIDIELMRLAQEIPTDVLNELGASQRNTTPKKEYKPSNSTYKKPYNNNNQGGYKKQYNKPSYNNAASYTSPYGQTFGSEKQWNKVQAHEEMVRNEWGIDLESIQDKQELVELVGNLFQYEKENK